jgi:hypothetical protein
VLIQRLLFGFVVSCVLAACGETSAPVGVKGAEERIASNAPVACWITTESLETALAGQICDDPRCSVPASMWPNATTWPNPLTLNECLLSHVDSSGTIRTISLHLCEPDTPMCGTGPDQHYANCESAISLMPMQSVLIVDDVPVFWGAEEVLAPSATGDHAMLSKGLACFRSGESALVLAWDHVEPTATTALIREVGIAFFRVTARGGRAMTETTQRIMDDCVRLLAHGERC